MVRDPVCDMDVEIDDAESQGLATEYDGKVFHFCSTGCKRLFDDDPMAYAGMERQSDAEDRSEDYPSAHE